MMDGTVEVPGDLCQVETLNADFDVTVGTMLPVVATVYQTIYPEMYKASEEAVVNRAVKIAMLMKTRIADALENEQR